MLEITCLIFSVFRPKGPMDQSHYSFATTLGGIQRLFSLQVGVIDEFIIIYLICLTQSQLSLRSLLLPFLITPSKSNYRLMLCLHLLLLE